MKTITENKIRAEMDGIIAQLKSISEMMAWLVKADQRFQIGQRVEWSRKGREQGFPRRKCAQRGTVKEVKLFSIVVKLDGLKKPTSFHHVFFNPVTGPKMF